MANTCYWTINGVAAASVGPPGQLGIAVEYCIADPLANALVVLTGGGYDGNITVTVNTPATQVGIIAACQTAIQAVETSYPLLTFVPIVT